MLTSGNNECWLLGTSLYVVSDRCFYFTSYLPLQILPKICIYRVPPVIGMMSDVRTIALQTYITYQKHIRRCKQSIDKQLKILVDIDKLCSEKSPQAQNSIYLFVNHRYSTLSILTQECGAGCCCCWRLLTIVSMSNLNNSISNWTEALFVADVTWRCHHEHVIWIV